MEVRFANDDLDRLETDPGFTMRLQPKLVSTYRRRLQQIRAMKDERDLYATKSLHFEKLQGQRQHQHSLRLDLQYRLIIEIRAESGSRWLLIVEIVDYHH